MMKKLSIFIFLLPLFVSAQDNHLMVQGASGNLYLSHKTAPKENYYSIGRIYNISPKEVAPYNKLVLEKGLSLGQEIKIPLKENFTQTGQAASDEALVPLYHKVSAKETLTQISAQYNKIPAASLKAWNNLGSDAITPGRDLIVGYLKVKKELSPYAQNGIPVPVVVASSNTPVKTEVKTPAVTPPVVKTEVKSTPPPAVVTQVKEVPVKAAPVPETKTVDVPVVRTGNVGFARDGIFKALYNNSGKEESGRAGIFKSTSGWEDGKYYCLHNTAPQGSVIKITNAQNGKFVYAKVLDVMPDLKQNAGLTVQLSNAGGDALGLTAGSPDFDCTISY